MRRSAFGKRPPACRILTSSFPGPEAFLTVTPCCLSGEKIAAGGNPSAPPDASRVDVRVGGMTACGSPCGCRTPSSLWNGRQCGVIKMGWSPSSSCVFLQKLDANRPLLINPLWLSRQDSSAARELILTAALARSSHKILRKSSFVLQFFGAWRAIVRPAGSRITAPCEAAPQSRCGKLSHPRGAQHGSSRPIGATNRRSSTITARCLSTAEHRVSIQTAAVPAAWHSSCRPPCCSTRQNSREQLELWR